MGTYKLSTAATKDIIGIYKFGIKTFGSNQAKSYVNSLERFIKELASRNELARDASIFARNLKYYRYKSHVIFYVFDASEEIFIIRILGKRMDFIQHL
ncbi:MAG: type II toxin-antitoxin system RelE/ParE family toxin [Polaribacter sp.]|uniref:type II toxin-antitoxin system RelE/ParE family toxin n=1 Tax=Polaribacter sp. TaxID=1920175 RepID=UPI003BAE5157